MPGARVSGGGGASAADVVVQLAAAGFGEILLSQATLGPAAVGPSISTPLHPTGALTAANNSGSTSATCISDSAAGYAALAQRVTAVGNTSRTSLQTTQNGSGGQWKGVAGAVGRFTVGNAGGGLLPRGYRFRSSYRRVINAAGAHQCYHGIMSVTALTALQGFFGFYGDDTSLNWRAMVRPDAVAALVDVDLGVPLDTPATLDFRVGQNPDTTPYASFIVNGTEEFRIDGVVAGFTGTGWGGLNGVLTAVFYSGIQKITPSVADVSLMTMVNDTLDLSMLP
jgi:hypothetical protein